MNDETDDEIFSRMTRDNGKKGGDATKKLYGTAHYSRIGKQGAKKKKKAK